MLKISLIIVLIISWKVTILAQPIANQFINVGLPTPDVASLGKFGDIPVSYETGIPNITIPIYEIKVGKISVPISLDYHAGGIKVNDIASSIGIGWALNCGGGVSRSLIGLPDELPGGYLSAPSSSDNYVVTNPGTYNNPVDYNFIFSVAGGGWYSGPRNEVQPDVFSYSLPGESGRFMFNHDASAFQIPLTNNQIKFYYNSNVNIPSYFVITNEEGIQFTFTDQEINSVQPGLRVDISQYVSDWKLTKIKDPNTSDEVSFVYTSQSGGTELAREDIWADEWVSSQGSNNAATTQETLLDVKPNYIYTQHLQEKFLQEIDWRGGKVSFVNQQDRLDQPSELRVNEINVYNSIGDLIKKAVLDNNHYFYNNSYPLSYDNSYQHLNMYDNRMYLNSVSFLPVANNVPPQVYSITYDNTPMASRYSCAQDRWGFNNGQFSNITLMQQQTITTAMFVSKTIGSANRDENSNYIKACSIQSITYPTGGKTVFDLEPNQYYDPNDPGNVVQGYSASCLAQIYPGNNINTPSSTKYFSPPGGSHNFKYSFIITQNNYPINNNQYIINVVDLSDNQSVLYLYGTSAGNSVNSSTPNYQTFNFNFSAGHTYAITCTAAPQGNATISPSTNIVAEMNVVWDQYVYTPVTGGGLRIKSLTNYDVNGKFINEDKFEYNEGILMTPPSFLIGSKVFTLYSFITDLGDLYYNSNYYSTAYYSNTILPATMMEGSPILYSDVVKYQTAVDASQQNGKTEYKYTINQDNYTQVNPVGLFGMNSPPKLISNSWQNGQLTGELIYKSTGNSADPYTLIKSKQYSYSLHRYITKAMMDIAPVYYLTNHYPGPPDPSLILNNYFVLNSYQIPSGIMLLDQLTNTDVDDNGNYITNTENYQYNNSNYISLTKKTATNSKAEIITENYKYPYDFSVSDNQYQKMVNKNNVAPIIQYQKLNGTAQLVQRTANYTDFNDLANTNPIDIPFLQPTSIDEQVGSNSLDTRIKFNSYDSYGNITQQQKTDDMFQSYIWDYNSMYPVAKVEGASADQIAYTSFESDETNSNWNFIPYAVLDNYFTGAHAYFMGGSAYNLNTKTPILPSNQYIVSYWSLGSYGSNGPYVVSGTQGPVRQGATINGWTYYEHTITGVSNVNISLSVSYGYIDELRLYPKGAQMETYTYDPLVGVIGQCDAANHTTTYEYDGFNRLSLVRDQNGNILKTYCYNYAGQSTNCDGNGSLLLLQNTSANSYDIKLTNVVNSKVYDFPISYASTTSTSLIGKVPLGTYNVQISSTGTSYGTGQGSQTNSINLNFGNLFYNGVFGSTEFNNVTIAGDMGISFQY